MNILGISDSHESHACMLSNGKIVAVMAEERISRLKADICYPRHSIESVINISGIKAENIDAVVFAGVVGSPLQKLYKLNALFSIKDWIDQCEKYWKPVLIEGKQLTEFDDFDMFKHIRGEELNQDPYLPFVKKARKDQKNKNKIFNNLRKEVVTEHLGIDPGIISFVRHEDCHKIYGYYSAPFGNNLEPALIFTVEGKGDDSSATVSIMDGKNLNEVWKSNDVQLGRLYRYVTLVLGMKPSQHEYKVMGLAPYSTEYHGKRSLEFFRTINTVDGTEIKDNKTVPDLYFSVKEALKAERFDGIAWGLQTYLEEILSEWISNNINKYKINNVILSGGVAQNIKACKTIAELNNIDKLWVGPISGDGSLAVGAAWQIHRKKSSNNGKIAGLPTVYLGTEHTRENVLEAISKYDLIDKFSIIDNYDIKTIAHWINDGYVVARFSGRLEFGQRALGNRSLLADPRKWETVEKINYKIKYRDFWMPFTPSMMIEEAERLLVNPKKIYSPYMTMAFDLKPEFHQLLPAVIHPADKTIRPQMLKKEDNPAYYEIMEEFKKITGFGVLLNTSFNMHGDQKVESPEDAINTLLKSEIDILAFDTVAISRVDI